MTGSALQEFLRSLGAPLAAVGVAPKSLADLRAAADALEPFKGLDLEQLADFLRRADESRRSGAVPLIEVAGVESVRTAARDLSESVGSLGTADGRAAEERIEQGRRELERAVSQLAGQFGAAVKFTADRKWLPSLRAKAESQRVAGALRRLAARITAPESYSDEGVKAEVEALSGTDAKALKAATTELGVAGTGKGRKLVESVLARMTGFENKPPKAPRKAAKPKADAAQVEEMSRTIRELAERAGQSPGAVTAAEVDPLIERLKAEFTAAQQKEIARAALGVSVRGGEEAIVRIRGRLLGAQEILDSQDV